MVWIALFFMIGIALSPLMPLLGPACWGIAAGLTCVGALGIRFSRGLGVAALLGAVLMLGILHDSTDNALPAWLIRRAPGIQSVTGTVTTYPNIGEDSISFTLTARDLPAALWVVWDCTDPLGRITVGDAVTVQGLTRLPQAFDDFDYPSYLARRGIFATLFADNVVQTDPVMRHGTLWSWGDRLRQRILTRLRETISPDAAAMAQSLMLGDRSALSQGTEDAFSKTGLMHLLAVSGLHLGIFLAVAWWGLRWLGLRPRYAYPIVGMLVLLALLVVGPRVSLVRAGLLFAFLALGSVLADFGLILRRWIHPLNGLAAAAIVILLLRPSALYDVGFQLTMAATASILIAFSPSGWGRRLIDVHAAGLGRGRAWLLQVLIVSVAAQAGTAPFIAWHFHALHPFSILINPVVVPLAALSLWSGLLAVLLMATPVFSLAVVPFSLLLQALERTVRGVATMPYVELPAAPIMGIWMGGCVAFLFLVAYYESFAWVRVPQLVVREATMNRPRLEP
jgi:ComEC/Rec2-related protein